LNTNYEYIVMEGKIAIGLPEYLKQFENIEKYNIRNYTFNDDLSIDVNGSVSLSNKGLTILPIKFRNVKGDFTCYVNYLTSLEGSPKTVGGKFNCYDNKLTSLEGCPKTVGDGFYSSSNNLTSLLGSPETVVGDFYCRNNNLTSLEGSPKTIGGNFYCDGNELTSLEGIGDVGGKICSDFWIFYQKWYINFNI